VDITPLAKNGAGFSPGVTGETNGTDPTFFDNTTLLWDAAAGKTGGGAKATLPFGTKNQQADFIRAFGDTWDLTGYEATADVKLAETGDVGECASVWIYAWGAGYGNDISADPAKGMAQKFKKGEWTTARFDLDGPYGYHSTQNGNVWKPTAVIQLGLQVVTFACP
jgi:hypothetical protein